jgi:hypothetical protein
MTSPFPGMDPYLESPAFWQDFHSRFINAWSESLADRLPASYEARIGERVFLQRFQQETHRAIEPDVAIHRSASAPSGQQHAAGGVATLEPTTLPQAVYIRIRRPYIEVRRRPDRSLVAVLELLSPSNKGGKDGAIYLSRRDDLLIQNVHLVELDLLLGGTRIELARPLPPGDYYCFITRADDSDECHVYNWTIHDPLPTLPIPLLAPDPDILIDYAAVFATTFDRGRYARSLAYDQPPEAPVRPDDLAWVRGRAASIRR